MKVAIIDGNILAAIGLKQILSTVMPMMHIDIFGTMAELHANTPDTYFHFFANTTIVLQDMAFFSRHRHKTIVLTTSTSDATQLTGFHSLCTSQSEDKFIKDGRNLPPQSQQPSVTDSPTLLSSREIEVLSHIAYGKTNKEIANTLCISLSTVVSHRKHIMDKLNIHNLSALTIYAVMHGYVDVNMI